MHQGRVALALVAAACFGIASSGASSSNARAPRELVTFAAQRGGSNLVLVDMQRGQRNQLTQGFIYDHSPALSPDGHRVAFVRGRQNPVLMTLDLSDRRMHTVLRSDLKITHPTWSPDGSKIAFASLNTSKLGIYVVNADGSGMRRLTQGNETALDPAWSPDGSTIAFADGRIWVVDAAGSSPEHVLIASPNAGLREPAWSLDGTRLTMRSESTSAKSGNSLLVANADGSAFRAIPLPRDYRSDPEWTHDGRVRFRISSTVYSVFPDGSGLRRIAQLPSVPECRRRVARSTSARPGEASIVYAAAVSCETIWGVQTDGSGFQRLADGPAIEPAYSRDGRRLAFLDPDHSRIYVAPSAGGRRHQVVRMARGSIYWAPSWSPDGRRLVFWAGQAIWVLDVDRKTLARLPGTGARDGLPDWGPNGLIAFSRGGATWVTKPDGTSMRRVVRNGVAPDWSPDGRKLAYLIPVDPGDDNDVAIVDLASGRTRRLTRTPNVYEWSPRWSPDGRLIAYMGRSGIVLTSARGTGRRLIDPGASGSISWRRLLR